MLNLAFLCIQVVWVNLSMQLWIRLTKSWVKWWRKNTKRIFVKIFRIPLILDPVFILNDENDEMVDNYMKEARKLSSFSNGYLLQVLYQNDFNTDSALSYLQKVLIFFWVNECSLERSWNLHILLILNQLVLADVSVTHVFFVLLA